VRFTHSISFRLLLMILLSMLLLWTAVLCFTWWRTSRDINNVYDAELMQVARLLAVATSHEAAELDLHEYQVDLSQAGYNYPLIFQVWDHTGRLMVRGPDAPDHALSSSQKDGFSDARFNDTGWRVYTMNLMNNEFRIQVARNHEVMRVLVRDFVLDVIKPLLLALPLFGMLWYVVHRGLEPLRQVSRLIAERDYGHLNPVIVENMPAESARLVDEINALLVRLKASIERNGRFTADVAHELRTPIAGMLVQLQSTDEHSSDFECQQVIGKVRVGLKRLNHVVNQLLTLASIEPEQIRQEFAPMELREVTREVISELSPSALEKGIEMELDSYEPVEYYGNKHLIAIMLSNLLNNSIKFTPQGGALSIYLAKVTNGVSMVVEDSGPGIPDESKEWVFERRNRVASGHGGGSGLGLSIVKEICKLHRATITLKDKSEGSGLIVKLFLPDLTKN